MEVNVGERPIYHEPKRYDGKRSWEVRRERERAGALESLREFFSAHPLLAQPAEDANWQALVDYNASMERNRAETGIVKASEAPKLTPEDVANMTRADRVIAFIEAYCRAPEGARVGKPLRLEPFQRKFVRDVFDNEHGTTLAILSQGRKGGKTALIATLALAFVVGPEAVLNAQIVSGAMEIQQAQLIANYALKMVQLSEHLRRVVDPVPSRRRFYGLAKNVEFRALASVASSIQGISPLVAILDEIGQIKGERSDFVDAITTAKGAYDNGLMIVISTQAAQDADLLSQMIDDAKKSANPHTVCHLYAAPVGCDIMDEKAWRAANPALGVFRSLPDMRQLAEKAKRMPSFEATFRNYNLNQRVETNNPFVSESVWRENEVVPDRLDGLTVYGGLDLSSVNDLCAFVLVSDKGDVHPFFWLPEEGLREKARQDKQVYDLWAKEGYLLTTPGRTVEYEYVAEFMRGVFDRCKVVKIGFDRYNMKFLRPWLLKAGFTEKELEKFVEFGQGFVSMSPALRDLEARLLGRRLRHGGHPVLTMCAANAVVAKDPAGNRKFNKMKATGRIDGMVALAMAVGVMPPDAGAEKRYQIMVF
jgi:phage terminase large subunit-like protein